MTKPLIQSMVSVSLLVLVGVFVLFVFVPGVASTRIIGYAGQYSGENFLVTRVVPGSPADEAGIEEGDLVLTQSGYPVSVWYRWYTTDIAAYLYARSGLIGKPIDHRIMRGQAQWNVSVGARPLTGLEILGQYGVRVFLIISVLTLAVFIIVSRTREQSAFLTCLCFCFAVFWFASDRPHWPLFYSPFIFDASIGMRSLADLVEVFSLQLVVGILLHISLMFPTRTKMLERYPWLPVVIYVASLAPPVGILLVGAGSLNDRLTAVYLPRLELNTVFIVVITLQMIHSYRRCKSAAEKASSRWIVASMGVIAVSHLVLWNLPRVITGSPLIQNYNWLLLTVVLLAVSLTMAITNHELFGIRGIIRGRIKLLEAMLRRQRRLVGSRDTSIRAMQKEIQELKTALDQYTVESGDAAGPGRDMEKLEREYPLLKQVREERLIGVSPLWSRVFEQAVLAAHGGGPVMIFGESGTGKTDLAWTVHALSERRDGVYREISCAQFEHADPAFALGRLFGIGSGHGLPNVPREGRKGLLEECDGGTLLLDDFDRLPLNVQDLFLYPLEGKPFEPGIGSGPNRMVSVKFIFATNRDPEQLAADGRFRSDVLARIVSRIDIPPLRQRREDIPVLVDHLVEHLSAELGHDISLVSNRAMHLLCRHPYRTGNVRELKAELQQAIGKALMEHDDIVRAGYLSEKLVRGEPGGDAVAQSGVAAASGGDDESSAELEVLRRHRFQINAAEVELGYSHKSRTLSNHLRGMCVKALVDADWDVDRAARSLAGPAGESQVPKLKAKIERFRSRIREHVRNRTESKLFNNLPTVYHEALTRAISEVGR